MRRLAAVLMLFLLSPLARASAFTASASGVWATALGGTPGADDTCTINTGVSVDCNAATCTCGSIINNGTLYCSVAAGCTWLIGNASANCDGAATDTVCAGASAAYTGTGEWTVGYLDTLKVDVGTAAAENTDENEIAPSALGLVRIRGKLVVGGEVLRVDETANEDCPQGSYSEDANGNPSSAIADCNTTFNVYVEIGRSLRADEFNGLVLAYTWPAARRGTWYDILDTIPPNILQLDADSRGQMRRHGYQETATATVAAGSASVTATSGFSAFDNTTGKWPVGGWFACTAADCTPTDKPPGGVSAENYYMPCTAARRIIAAPTTTTLTLKNVYVGAGCAAGAAATIIWEPGGWNDSNADGTYDDFDYIEGPTGPFQIVDPAVVTTNTAPADINPPGANSLLRQYYFKPADNGSLDIDYAAISFCGRSDATVADQDCIECQYSTSNTSGTCDLDWSEVAWYHGNMVLSLQNNAGDINLVGNSFRDVLPSNLPLPLAGNNGNGHGIRIMDNNTATIRDVVVDQLSTRRVGDDSFQLVYDPDDAKVGGRTTQDYDDATYSRSTNVWGSMVANVASCECVDFSTPGAGVGAGLEGTFLIDKLLCSNMHDGGINAPNDVGNTFEGIVIKDSIIRNVGGSCYVNTASLANDWADFENGFKVINTVCSVPGVSTNGNIGGWITGGILYSSLAYGQGAMNSGAGAYGVLWVNRGSSTGGTGFDMQTADTSIFPTTPTFRDVACSNRSANSATCFEGIDGASSPAVTIDHLTHMGGGGGSELMLRNYNTNFTMTNSVSGRSTTATILLSDNSPACPTFTNDYNYMLRTPSGTTNDCSVGASGCTCTFGANSLPTNGGADSGQLGFASLSIPNLTITPTSTPYTSLGSDGTHRGARVAGPSNWQILELLYPPLKSLGRPGVYDPAYAVDSDGDGIYDIHDACPADSDPLCT